jgi:enterochelin esterase-like enzyme
MKLNRNTSGFLPLLITTGVLLLSCFQACKKEPDVKEKPFVRLLESETIQSTILKRSIKYSVLLPENYNTSTDSFPVVYLLHGLGDDQSSWYNYGLIKYYSDLYASENVPMIFVMPQGFNTYYVNKYNGSFPYMDFFATELVPAIDSVYHTKKDKTQRAVMGYSMGGYGALILPVINPDVFSVSVPLSMSFRTDDQYIAEPDGAFNYQWGPVFGGIGTQGSSRLTEYFKENSPFHFFKDGDLSRFGELKIFIDCGDDEESLSFTNNALHSLMRDNEIKHEYRVRNGGHSWNYWHASLHEALHFISLAFEGINYPDNPENIVPGAPVPSENTSIMPLTGTGLEAGILIPPGYDTISGNYPVIYLVHDYQPGNREELRSRVFSLLFNSMISSDLVKSLVIEIPFESSVITEGFMQEVIKQVDMTYKTRKEKSARILTGNGQAGALAAAIVVADTSSYSSCFLFNASLPDGTITSQGNIFYYLDGSDEGQSFQAYENLYIDIRNNKKDYEYRIRQGDDSYESFLNGLSNSIPILKKRLSITS